MNEIQRGNGMMILHLACLDLNWSTQEGKKIVAR